MMGQDAGATGTLNQNLSAADRAQQGWKTLSWICKFNYIHDAPYMHTVDLVLSTTEGRDRLCPQGWGRIISGRRWQNLRRGAPGTGGRVRKRILNTGEKSQVFPETVRGPQLEHRTVSEEQTAWQTHRLRITLSSYTGEGNVLAGNV